MRVWVLWALFLVRAIFYCTMLPLWEGWDEYAHFARVENSVSQEIIPGLNSKFSLEVEESLQLAPLPYELRWMPPPDLTHEAWWKLPDAERAKRMEALRNLSPALAKIPGAGRMSFYEAQQPPLYYWLLSVPARTASSWTLEHRVLLIRLLSALLASCAIPLTWGFARKLMGDGPAFLAAAILAAAPGFVIDASRVANDSAAIAFFALTLWLLTRSKTTWLAMGLVLGAGLLSKAYLLVLIPVLIVCWFRRRRDLLLTLVIAGIAAGWWYARNVWLGNSFSGWLEHPAFDRVIAGVFQIYWPGSVAVIAKSFLWFGAWSFLTVKSWIYVLLEVMAMACSAIAIVRKSKALRVPLIASGAFLAAMVYGTLVYNAVHGIPNLPGWYLWPAGGVLAAIVAAGPRYLVVGFVAMLTTLDLYGAAGVMMPYYAGFVARNHADLKVFFDTLQRLGVPLALAFLWAGATAAIPAIAWRSIRN